MSDWWMVPARSLGWVAMMFFVSWAARAISRRIPPGRARQVLTTPHQNWKNPWLGPALLIGLWLFVIAVDGVAYAIHR